MKAEPKNEVSSLLHDWSQGSLEALDRLFPRVLDYLERTAAKLLNEKFYDLRIEPDELVNQSYLLLRRKSNVDLKDVQHFYRLAAKVMYCYLTDEVRRRNAKKNWGGMTRAELYEGDHMIREAHLERCALAQIFRNVHRENEVMYKVAVLRGVCQYSIAETAQILDVSNIKVSRVWSEFKSKVAGEALVRLPQKKRILKTA